MKTSALLRAMTKVTVVRWVGPARWGHPDIRFHLLGPAFKLMLDLSHQRLIIGPGGTLNNKILL